MADDERPAEGRLRQPGPGRHERWAEYPVYSIAGIDPDTPVVSLDSPDHVGRDHLLAVSDAEREALSFLANMTAEDRRNLVQASRTAATLREVQEDTQLWQASRQERRALLPMIRRWTAWESILEQLIQWFPTEQARHAFTAEENRNRERSVARTLTIVVAVVTVLQMVTAVVAAILARKL